MNDIVLLGGGGHAVVVAELIALSETWRLRAIVVADRGGERPILGVPVLSGDETLVVLRREGVNYAIVAFGSVRATDRRAVAAARLVSHGYEMPVLRHPHSTVSPSAAIGPGTVVMAGAVVNARAAIGTNVIINTAAIVEHECLIADHVHVSPAAVVLGGASVGEQSHVGAGARILQGVRVGARVTVGAGAVVTRDIPDGATAIGVPAKLTQL